LEYHEVGVRGLGAATTLRRATTTICALVTLLPLLVAVWLLGRGEALSSSQTTVGLGLAALVSLLGCVIVSRTFGEVSRLALHARAIIAGGAAEHERLAPDAVPVLGKVAELGALGHALANMMERLQTSATRFDDVVGKLDTLTEIVNRETRLSRPDDL